jgi:seryl-tRNA synthetase
LDVKMIRRQPDLVRQALGRRGLDSRPVDELLELDARRRELIVKADELKARRNQVSQELGRLKRQGVDISQQAAEMRAVGDEIQRLDAERAQVEERERAILEALPNLPHPDVPPGQSDQDNVLVRSWGEPSTFPFTPRPHWEIGEDLDILDFKRSAKICGSRFWMLKGAGARLERALITYMLDLHTGRHGYTEILPPALVNRATMYGTGQLPKFEDDLFKCRDSDLYLIPTSEVPVTNLHRDEILEADQLPLYYCAFSPCFRSEAGAAGRDTRGLIRVHQFHKVEMVKFTTPDTSYDELEKMVTNAEAVLQGLGLAYRVMLICVADLGFSAAKKYDLEFWSPGQNRWIEVSSCSNCTDFQARRANIRYRPEPRSAPEFVHTLNGSGLAVGRTLAAVLENYQQADGSVLIPEVLRPYMGGMEKITRP